MGILMFLLCCSSSSSPAVDFIFLFFFFLQHPPTESSLCQSLTRQQTARLPEPFLDTHTHTHTCHGRLRCKLPCSVFLTQAALQQAFRLMQIRPKRWRSGWVGVGDAADSSLCVESTGLAT